jgi:hypothetical protein
MSAVSMHGLQMSASDTEVMQRGRKREVENAVVWHVTSCSPEKSSPTFRGTLLLKSKTSSKVRNKLQTSLLLIV